MGQVWRQFWTLKLWTRRVRPGQYLEVFVHFQSFILTKQVTDCSFKSNRGKPCYILTTETVLQCLMADNHCACRLRTRVSMLYSSRDFCSYWWMRPCWGLNHTSATSEFYQIIRVLNWCPPTMVLTEECERGNKWLHGEWEKDVCVCVFMCAWPILWWSQMSQNSKPQPAL